MLLLVFLALALPAFLQPRWGPQSRPAQSTLRNGIAAAMAYFSDGDDVYTGFDAAEGATIEPSLTWVDGDATNENLVNVSGVSPPR